MVSKTKKEKPTLSSVLIKEDREHVIRNDGSKVRISELITGKTVCLYFAARWSPSCLDFNKLLLRLHSQLDSTGMVIIFVSSDMDEANFKSFFATMPWFALPFPDKTNLFEHLKVKEIPSLLMFDTQGLLISMDGVKMVKEHGVQGLLQAQAPTGETPKPERSWLESCSNFIKMKCPCICKKDGKTAKKKK